MYMEMKWGYMIGVHCFSSACLYCDGLVSVKNAESKKITAHEIAHALKSELYKVRIYDDFIVC